MNEFFAERTPPRMMDNSRAPIYITSFCIFIFFLFLHFVLVSLSSFSTFPRKNSLPIYRQLVESFYFSILFKRISMRKLFRVIFILLLNLTHNRRLRCRSSWNIGTQCNDKVNLYNAMLLDGSLIL